MSNNNDERRGSVSTAMSGYGIEHIVPDSPAMQLPDGWVRPKTKQIYCAPIMNTPKRTVLPPAMPAPINHTEHVFDEVMKEAVEDNPTLKDEIWGRIAQEIISI